MIKSFEELGEVLADFETRLLTLENSISPNAETYPKEPKIIFKRRPVDDEIDQLKGQVLFLQNKVNELTPKRKPHPEPKIQPKVYIYEG